MMNQEEAGSTGATEGRPVRAPWNSRRITAEQLRRVGRAMDVPTTASTDEVRVMIEAKLTELGREPRNVQILLEPSSKISLQDESGEFLVVEPELVEERPATQEGGTLSSDEEDLEDDVETLRAALQEAQTESEQLRHEVTSLNDQLAREKARVKEVWSINCEYVAQHDQLMLDKDDEITRLKTLVDELQGGRESPNSSERSGSSGSVSDPPPRVSSRSQRRGRAPPVDHFTGEDRSIRFEDWIPALERAAQWNGWTESDQLLQLAGHLRGKALQEWNLLQPEDKSSLSSAKKALKTRLDPGSQTLAAQEFRHLSQRNRESVGDFITRLEKTFRMAYGRDQISTETRSALLYAQLQEGLRFELLQAPAVSGAESYTQLCVAAKSEERRLAVLQKKRQYTSSDPPPNRKSFQAKPGGEAGVPRDRGNKLPDSRACHNCGKIGHFAKACRSKKTESKGNQKGSSSQGKSSAKQVQSCGAPSEVPSKDPLDFLLSSDSEDGDVKMVRVKDKGSRAQRARVDVQGVPADGVIDSGSDITIIGGDLFKHVASVARLRKKQFKRADKTARTYDMRPFKLDGRMDLDISFGDRTMRTPVYIKMDSPTQLLLSEGVCRQLEILSYHPSILSQETLPTPVDQGNPENLQVNVPMVSVKLLQSTKLLPQMPTAVKVKVCETHLEAPMVIEPSSELIARGVSFDNAVVQPGTTVTSLELRNLDGFTQTLPAGEELGVADAVSIVADMVSIGQGPSPTGVPVMKVNSESVESRREKITSMFNDKLDMPSSEKRLFCDFLADNHTAFCLEEGERGETDLVQLHIDTKDSPPIKQAPRRTPFIVKSEVDKQVREMQEAGVIQKSHSPWASPVILVKKKDGSYRFCIDYRKLNQVTVKDTFPLPRIDDLLDQLGQAKYFSTLDLASGYWQIKVAEDSKKKTTFVTHRGLYEFNVMPFGLTNAPAVFQRLVQEVLAGLNPDDGPAFVSAYIDDIIVFSRTLEEHLKHLRLVLTRLLEAGLKLNPEKCKFIRQLVEYLGFLVTPQGLKPTEKHVEAVKNFPVPTSVSEVRRFLGLASYYRRFVAGFAKLASPLHALTKKMAEFKWSEACQVAFESLKRKLIEAPLLVYPTFDREFVLETDASILGLGAVLSQERDDCLMHPIAYASRALSPCEKNYGITDLETLAVVWALSHFKVYLYGQRVKVVIDHTAVKSVLLNPTASGKHARWWAKVFESGIGEVNIVYRRGSENSCADALSRSPCGDPPHFEDDVGVAVFSMTEICELLDAEQADVSVIANDLRKEQQKDPQLYEIIQFLGSNLLPTDERRARKIALQADQFSIVDDILYFIESKKKAKKRAVVPEQLRKSLLESSHRGSLSGHLSGPRLYKALSSSFWWEGMYKDAVEYCRSCPQCVTVSGGERVGRPPLQTIPVQRPFQVIGVDIMDLPKTVSGNKHVLVFQDFLSKWPMVFAMPDQKTHRIVNHLVKDVIPIFGVPENLLSDRGTNLLSFLMRDVCDMLGITKLNTTAYHPQCNGMVERFNRTLKTMLRKHVETWGKQWDEHLHAVLWAYRNTPHETTGEKPSYLLFGKDLRTPSEATFLPGNDIQTLEAESYREQLAIELTLARENAAKSIQTAQSRYKKYYDRGKRANNLKKSEWIMIRFPHDETGAERKLSRPWHGPYRVLSTTPTGVVAEKIYSPQDGTIQVHLDRVTRCPPNFPAGYYWYGSRRKGPGRPPKWLSKIAEPTSKDVTQHEQDSTADVEEPAGTPLQEDKDIPPPVHEVPGPQTRTRTRVVKPPLRYSQELGTS